MQIQASRIPIYRKVAMAVASLAAVFGMAAAAIGVGALAPGDSVTYTAVPFDTSEWTVDRYAPTGGVSVIDFGGRTNVLEMNVDATATPPSSTFRYYEGLKRDIDGATAVKADLYVDSSWPNAPTQAGIWGVGRDAGDVISAYPIVEYTTNNNGYTGWRAFDDQNGVWMNFPGTTTNVDGWNTVEIVFNSDNTNFDLYVNSNKVGSSVATGSVDLSAVILNNRNYYGDGASYTVRWSNLHTGVVSTDTTKPTVAITSHSTGDVVGGSVTVQGTASDPVGIDKVNYTVTEVSGIGGTFVSSVASGTATGTENWGFDVSGLTDGFYRLKVQAFDNAGNWRFKFVDVEADTTKPTVAITNPADGATLYDGTFTVTGTAADANGIERVDYTVNQITGFGGTYVASVDSGTATGTNNWSFDVNSLADGFYRLKVQAFDSVGNWRYKYVDVQVMQAPADKNACKDGGWAVFSTMDFKNQGDCVSYVNHNDGNGNDDNKARSKR